MNSKKIKGFSDVELLLVIATIALLNMLMVSYYSNYVRQAQMTEGLSLFTGARLHLGLQYAVHGRLSADTLDNMALKTTGKEVHKMSISTAGLVNISFKNTQLPRLQLQPQFSPATRPPVLLAWHCSSPDANAKSKNFLPSLCR